VESGGTFSPGSDRLAAVRSLGLVGTAPEARFDQLTQLARRIMIVPISTFELLEDDRIWCKSHPGLEAEQLPRLASFSDEVIDTGGPLVVEDAAADPRFEAYTLVSGIPQVRFFAGVPVRGPSGQAVGVLSVMDIVPRALAVQELDVLVDLALMIESELASAHGASTDDVTGLFTREAFERIGDWLLELTSRRTLHSFLVCAEVTGVDTATRPGSPGMADQVLVDAASVLRSAVRGSDLLGRLGDRQVGILLVNAKAGTFPTVTSRIAQAMAHHRGEVHRPYELSFAYGLAEHDPHAPRRISSLVESAKRELLD